MSNKFKASITPWTGPIHEDPDNRSATIYSTYEEIMAGIGHKYALLAESTTIQDTVDNWLVGKTKTGIYARTSIFKSFFMSLVPKNYPYEIKWTMTGQKIRAVRDSTFTGRYGYLARNLRLQFYQAQMFLWEASEAGTALRYKEPAIFNISTDDQYYRLEPGGTRTLFKSMGHIQNELIIVCPIDLVDRYFPNKAKRDAALKYAEILINRRMLFDENLIAIFQETYDSNDIEKRRYFHETADDEIPHSIPALSFMPDKNSKVENHPTLNYKAINHYDVDLAAMSSLTYEYKDREMTLSDGTLLFTVDDDCGINIPMPTECPKYWKRK